MDSLSIGSLSSFASSQTQTQTPAVSPDQRALLQAARSINASGKLGADNELSVIVDRSSRIPVARIVSRATGEVIEQIPTEQVLLLAEE